MNKSLFLVAALAACAGAQAQVIATDTAAHAAYSVGQTYHGINGGTGAWDPIGWVSDDWNGGHTLLVQEIAPTYNLGSVAFAVNAANGGGSDSRRKLLNALPIGSTVTWSMAINFNATAGEFYLDVRSPNANPNRDMLLLIGEVGVNWRVNAIFGGIQMSVPFTTPMVPGQRVDGAMTVTGQNTFAMRLTPFGGTASNIVAGNFYTTGQSVQVLNFSNWGLDAESYFNNILVTGPGVPTQTVSGTIQLADTVSTFAHNRTITYTVKQGTNTIASSSVLADSSSESMSFNIPAAITGNVQVTLDGSSFLKRVFNVNLTGSNQNFGTIVVQNGDVNNSAEVDAADIDDVIANFGSGGNIPTDPDVSGEVDAADIDIVIANFGGTDQP
ncbi:MAG: hypothetical protein JNK63_02395 [Chthonomonas sp.]|nr:hypothetical protein [Chthonomonas sp.]